VLARHLAPACAILTLSFATPTALAAPAAGSGVTVRWTAPGDDGRLGRAVRYDLRYSLLPITPLTFSYASAVPGVPAPRAAGSVETFSIPGLALGLGYSFAIRTVDDRGFWSKVSNIPYLPPQGPTLAAGDEPTAFWCSAPWPNPAQAMMRCSFALPVAAAIEMSVFDLTGRRVRQLASGWHPAGREEATWDLRTEGGARAEPGVYLIRAQLGDRAWTHRVTVVR
jgi:hypothetical protein